MAATGPVSSQTLYRTLWRWHFYAGLFVLPFVITLSVSGALYLFKPQIDHWEERAFHDLPVAAPVTPRQQAQAALDAHAGAVLLDYRLPEHAGDAAMVRLALPQGQGLREVFVAPQGRVLASLVPEERTMAVVKRLHSELLVGGVAGNRLVELAASWAIVLLVSGLYLWWPRGRGLAGVLWPRRQSGTRVFWRDLHAVTGFWISGLALVLLLTGLPWTGVWGGAFQSLRTEMGWVKGGPAWDIGGQPAQAVIPTPEHHGGMMNHSTDAGSYSLDGLDVMVAKARAERLAFPAIVTVPGGPGRFDQPGEWVWTLRSDALNTPLQQLIRFDAGAGQELSRERFQDGHVIDRIVGYGIAWHQGQLFGWMNQLIGVLTALGLVTLATSGFMLWRRRKPEKSLGAPRVEGESPARIVVAILLVCALLLPLLAASLVLVVLLERLVLPRLPRLADWLGVPVRP
ncbi:MAG TPA: PepSY domain-containing protein [Hyphomicrobiales bacterium]|nr:PepSY domain-containing protein [Hyphomicrobiales bacterium]